MDKDTHLYSERGFADASVAQHGYAPLLGMD
jgi:hypothetical protein